MSPILSLFQAVILIAIDVVATGLLVGPVVYFLQGRDGIGAAILGVLLSKLALVWPLNLPRERFTVAQFLIINAGVSSAFAASYGIFLPDAIDPATHPAWSPWWIVTLAITWGTVVGMILRLIEHPQESSESSLRYRLRVRLGLTVVFAFFVPFFPVLGLISDLPGLVKLALALCVVIALVGSLAIGRGIASVIVSALPPARLTARYLRALGAAALFFVLGYLVLIVLFAGAYGVIWRADPNSICGSGWPEEPALADILYFSTMTITTVGYGDIAPASNAARLTAMAEVISGFVWATIILAATAAQLARREDA